MEEESVHCTKRVKINKNNKTLWALDRSEVKIDNLEGKLKNGHC